MTPRARAHLRRARRAPRSWLARRAPRVILRRRLVEFPVPWPVARQFPGDAGPCDVVRADPASAA
jgi:hypothetical protein